jgi:preprotein translocase subunit SecB
MSAPEMWRFEWERRSPFTDCEDDDSLPLSLGLGLSRPSHDHLIVELSVEVDTQQARFVVAYRSEWEIEDYITFSDTEGTMRSIAGQLGPSALYPFIREAVTSASIKSGLPPITLPVINFREFFNLEDIQIPSWQEE